MLPRSKSLGARFFSILQGNHAFRVPINHEVHGIIKWIKPQKLEVWDPERSCDMKPFPKIDPNWLQLEYRPFASLINELTPDKRKLFTVEFGKRRHAFEVIMEDTLDSVRRHKYDKESYEYRIASLTIKIRNFQDILQHDVISRRNGGLRKATKEMTDKRRQYMNRLKNLDYKRFEWIIYMMGILYKPNTLPSERVERKRSMTMLTEIYCETLRQKKMDAYRAELESQKLPFLEEKLATLNQIKSDEEAMRIPSSVDEDIEKTLKQIEKVKNSHIVLEPVPEDQKLVES